MAINKIWHENNRMPKNATDEQKVRWHIAHAKNCDCRPPSAKMLAEMKKMGFIMIRIRPKSKAKK